jgi:hypothetical protein
MGHGITISCQFCSYSREFTLGVGMEYFSLKNVMNILPQSKRLDVKKILDYHRIKETDYSHELFQCRDCNRLYDKFHVKIIYDDDQFYETDYRCNKCDGPLILKSENDLPQMPCPKCGGEGLNSELSLMWD